MRITRRQLRTLIESTLNEIGPGVGMGDGDLAHATTDPQNILAALSILPGAFVPTAVASAVLYYLDDDKEAAAKVLALTLVLGAGGAVLRKAIPALRAAFKAAGSRNPSKDADELVKLASKIDRARAFNRSDRIPIGNIEVANNKNLIMAILPGRNIRHPPEQVFKINNVLKSLYDKKNSGGITFQELVDHVKSPSFKNSHVFKRLGEGDRLQFIHNPGPKQVLFNLKL